MSLAPDEYAVQIAAVILVTAPSEDEAAAKGAQALGRALADERVAMSTVYVMNGSMMDFGMPGLN